MHRSGTSLVTRLVEQMGVFMGQEKQGDWEAIFFLNLNDHILRELKLSWDKVMDGRLSLSANERSRFIDYIIRKFGSDSSRHYWGDQVPDSETPWGWKDPRNTITFEIWKELFPDMKVIHVMRNPLDVANSLKVRFEKSRDYPARISKAVRSLPKKFCRWNWEKRVKHEDSPWRFVDIDKGVDLWRSYLRAAGHVKSGLAADQFLEIRYEDLLTNSVPEMERLRKFIDLDIDDEVIQSCIDQLNPSRAYAFRSDDELVRIYHKLRSEPWMEEFGYHEIIQAQV